MRNQPKGWVGTGIPGTFWMLYAVADTRDFRAGGIVEALEAYGGWLFHPYARYRFELPCRKRGTQDKTWEALAEYLSGIRGGSTTVRPDHWELSEIRPVRTVVRSADRPKGIWVDFVGGENGVVYSTDEEPPFDNTVFVRTPKNEMRMQIRAAHECIKPNDLVWCITWEVAQQLGGPDKLLQA